MTQELSYKIASAKITDKKREHQLEASLEECEALADRFDVLEVSNVKANLVLQYKTGLIYVLGDFSCDVTQECVVTLEPVSNHLKKEFEVLFNASSKELNQDTIMDGRTIDSIKDGVLNLGEIIAQQISLALPDFPKAKTAEFTNHIEAPEVLEEPEERTHRPFADLLQGVTVLEDKDKDI